MASNDSAAVGLVPMNYPTLPAISAVALALQERLSKNRYPDDPVAYSRMLVTKPDVTIPQMIMDFRPVIIASLTLSCIVFLFGVIYILRPMIMGLRLRCRRMCGMPDSWRRALRPTFSVRSQRILCAVILACALSIFTFAGFLLQSNKDVSSSLDDLQNGINATFADSQNFLKRGALTSSTSGDTIDNATSRLSQQILSYPVITPLDKNLDPTVMNLFAVIQNISDAVVTLRTSVMNASTSAATCENNRIEFSTSLSKIQASMNALAIPVVIQGVTYTPTGIPSSDSLSPIRHPILLPYVALGQVYGRTLAGLPDTAKSVAAFRVLYALWKMSVPNMFKEKASEIIEPKTDNVMKLADIYAARYAGMAMQLDAQVEDYQTSVNNVWDQTVESYDRIRFILTIVQTAVLCLVFPIFFIGLFTRQKRALWLLAPICAIMSLLLWAQFAAYYVASFPLNVACPDREELLARDYDVSNSPTPIFISPKIILDNCHDGQSLLTMTLDNNKTTAAKLLGVEYLLGGSGVEALGLQKAVNEINVLDVNSTIASMTNVSKYLPDDLPQIPTITADRIDLITGDGQTPYNLVQVAESLKQFRDSVSPGTFKPNWNQGDFDRQLRNFERLVNRTNQAKAGSFALDQLSSVYIVPNRAFEATDVSGDPKDSNNGQLLTKFAALRPLLEFYVASKPSEAKLRTRVDDVIASLNAAPINSLNDQLNNNLQSLKGNVTAFNAATGVINTAREDIVAASDGVGIGAGAAVAAVVADIVQMVVAALELTFTNVLHNAVGFAICKDVAIDIRYAIEATCDGVGASMNAMWFSLLIISSGTTLAFAIRVMLPRRLHDVSPFGKPPSKSLSSSPPSSAHGVDSVAFTGITVVDGKETTTPISGSNSVVHHDTPKEDSEKHSPEGLQSSRESSSTLSPPDDEKQAVNGLAERESVDRSPTLRQGEDDADSKDVGNEKEATQDGEQGSPSLDETVENLEVKAAPKDLNGPRS